MHPSRSARDPQHLSSIRHCEASGRIRLVIHGQSHSSAELKAQIRPYFGDGWATVSGRLMGG